jgi:hypothetical protein
MKRNRKRLLAACATGGVALFMALAPGVALAGGNPNDTQYGNPSQTEQVHVKSGAGVQGVSPARAKSPTDVKPTTGTLPFTGQDLGLVVGLGALFIIVGLGLRFAVRGRRAS